MRDLRRNIGLAASVLALACAAPALAQGPSGGGGGGGGGAGGGGGTTTPPPSSGSCATITGFTNPTGYYSVWAAVWTHYAVANACNRTLTWTLTYTNGTTGAVDFARYGSVFSTTASGIVDEDWAALSTTYTVTLAVTDTDGSVLASQSAEVITKPPKSATGG
jgi:hypothetical protein